MKETDWIYILSIAFQLAGAIVLLLNCLTKRDVEEKVEEERPKILVANSKRDGEDKAEEMIKNFYASKYIEMYKNAIAFIFLILGYGFSIWGTNEYKNKIYIAIWVSVLCIVFCSGAWILAKVLGKCQANRKDYSILPDGTVWAVLGEAIGKEEVVADNKQVEEDAECDNSEENKEINSKKYDFDKITKITLAVISILSTFYLVINEIHKYQYRVNCEDYYRIPRAFFESDIKDGFIYFSISIILIIAITFPSFMRGIYERSENSKERKEGKISCLFLAVLLGVAYGLVNTIYIMGTPIIKDIFKEDAIGRGVCVAILMICGIMAVCGMTLVPELIEIKDKKIRKICTYICVGTLFITISGFVSRIVSELNVPIQDKKDYEFILNAEKQYVVLDDVGDEVLVVEYSHNEELDEITFYTKSYTFLTRSEYSYAYGYLSKPPIIKYDIKTEDNIIEPTAEGE